MKCEKCGFIIPFNDAPGLTHCTMCGIPLAPDMADIFEHKKYGIVTEVRPTQVSLAQDIEEVLNQDKGTLLAEGGTGIGKSFAYVIPALLKEGKRIVISTAKKTLQDQLYQKDIPYLINKLGLKVSYEIYKGKSNYACWKLVKSKTIPEEDRTAFKTFIDIAKSQKQPADVANWPGTKPNWWYSIDGENCMLGSKCPHYDHCLPQPKHSRVVVTNHSLVALDMKIAPGSLLGPYDILIIDEAHQLPDALRSAWTISVTEKGLQRLKKLFENDTALRGLVDDLGIITARALMGQFVTLQKTYTAVIKFVKKMAKSNGAFDASTATEPLKEMRTAAETIGIKLFKMLTEIERAYAAKANLNSLYEPDELLAIQSRLLKLYKRVVNVTNLVTATINGDPTVDPNESNTFISIVDDTGIHLKPLLIGKLVAPRIKGIRHKIFLSATLAVNEKFDYAAEELGLTQEQTISTSIYHSAFDINKQAILYMPTTTPLPAYSNTEEREPWVRAMASEIVQLTRATKGDAFVLFTAHSDMNEIAQEVDGIIPNLIVQDGDTTALLTKYKNTKGAVLFGLKTFWEGVDIPGNKLKLVIIPKLPFPHPKDPIIAGMCEIAGDKWFNKVLVPRMLFDMKQGVGRLLRTKFDKGVVAILDVRGWTGTKSTELHMKRLQQIKYAPTKQPIGYGLKLVQTLGYANRIADNFEVCEKFINKFFPEQ